MWDLFLNSSVKQQLIHTAKLALFGALVWLQISILNRANGKALFGALILLQINISNRASSKALFGKESCQRS